MIGSPVGESVAQHHAEQDARLVPTIVQLELARWLTRVVKPPPARRSGSVAGVTGACVCDGWGLNWLRVG